MGEETAANMRLVQRSMILTGMSLVVIIWQGMSGIGQLGYTFSGWVLASSHARSGEFGFMIALFATILYVVSKHDDSRIKGMMMGYTAMWFIQIGLSHAYEGPHWLGMVHVFIAFMMFGHGLFLMPRFKEALASDNEAESASA